MGCVQSMKKLVKNNKIYWEFWYICVGQGT